MNFRSFIVAAAFIATPIAIFIYNGQRIGGKYNSNDGIKINITTISPGAFNYKDIIGRCIVFWTDNDINSESNYFGSDCGPQDLNFTWKAKTFVLDNTIHIKISNDNGHAIEAKKDSPQLIY